MVIKHLAKNLTDLCFTPRLSICELKFAKILIVSESRSKIDLGKALRSQALSCIHHKKSAATKSGQDRM